MTNHDSALRVYVPGDAAYRPKKFEVTELWRAQDAVNSALNQKAGSNVVFATTKAELDASTPGGYPAYSEIASGPDAGIWTKESSGAAWVKRPVSIADLRGINVVRLTVVSYSGSALTCSSAIDLPTDTTGCLYLVTVPAGLSAANLSVTVPSLISGIVFRAMNTNQAISGSSIIPGAELLLSYDGTKFRLAYPADASDALVQVNAARDEVEADRQAVEQLLSQAANVVNDTFATPEAFDGSGVSDQDAVGGAFGTGKPVFINNRRELTAYDNRKGQPVVSGPNGVIAVADADYPNKFEQVNHYNDGIVPIADGRMFMGRAAQFINLMPGNSANTLRAFYYGDSTGTADHGNTIAPIFLLRDMFVKAGIGNVFFTNRSVSGTQFSDMNVVADLGAQPGLAVIKFGINDRAAGANPSMLSMIAARDAMLANLEAKLQGIRSDPNGGVNLLSILLIGPSTVYDPTNERHSEWFELIVPALYRMALKYQCGWFDAYGWGRHAKGTAGVMLDQPYAGDTLRGVHPQDAMLFPLMGAVMEEFFPRAWLNLKATNSVVNEGSVTSNINAGLSPANWPLGYSLYRAIGPGNGFPIDGQVATTRNPDTTAHQVLTGYAGGTPKIAMRTARIATNTWSPWSGVAEPVTLLDSWVTGGQQLFAIIGTDNMVSLVGRINRASAAARFSTLGNIPDGFRPSTNVIVSANDANKDSGQVQISTDGNIGILFDQGLVDLNFDVRYTAA